MKTKEAIAPGETGEERAEVRSLLVERLPGLEEGLSTRLPGLQVDTKFRNA